MYTANSFMAISGYWWSIIAGNMIYYGLIGDRISTIIIHEILQSVKCDARMVQNNL